MFSYIHMRCASAVAHATGLAVSKQHDGEIVAFMDSWLIDHGSIYNLRQKVAGVAAISEEEYDALNTATQTTSRHRAQVQKSEERMEERGVRILPKRNTTITPKLLTKGEDGPAKSTSHNDPISGSHSATQCLFCQNTSPSLAENLHHMSSTHGLFIPSIDRVVDLQCFLAYLSVLVYEYMECVYCGAGKNSVQAVQTHMRDKGHCKIDVDELCDFWEASEERDEEVWQDDDEDAGRPTERVEPQDAKSHFATNPTSAQRPLTSDSALTRLTPTQKPNRTSSHNKHTQHKHDRRAEPLDTTIHASRHQTNISPSTRDLLKCNRELVNLNLPLSQLRSLATLNQRMRTQETTARARIQHKAERQPTKCIYYKTENPVYQAG